VILGEESLGTFDVGVPDRDLDAAKGRGEMPTHLHLVLVQDPGPNALGLKQ
jgi:hypothetical protein